MTRSASARTRSLLDTADTSALRDLMAAGPPAAVAAVLVDSGVLQFDPDDPGWEDRDRVIVAGAATHEALSERLAAGGADPEAVLLPAPSGGDAMALALGAAAGSRLDAGVWRAWCVLDTRACDDGRVWEVARAAAAARLPELAILVAGAESEPLWRACGWDVHLGRSGDPLWLLGALDQSLVGPAAVVLVTDG